VANSDFSRRFLDETCDLLARIDVNDIEGVVSILATVRERQGRLFFCGSGGGAGHSSHAACDFRKLAGFEAYSVSDNVSELTARVNDDGWADAYAAWLRVSNLRGSDCVFVFSVGGGSAEHQISLNLINAMRLAKARAAMIVGIVGRDGGVLRDMADASILIPVGDPQHVTAQTEGLQALLWHLIVTHPILSSSEPKWESLVP
jgi:D-sedoheptulose 7-phosphate isomerase